MGTDKLIVALAGQPNCGKSTVFNALTEVRQQGCDQTVNAGNRHQQEPVGTGQLANRLASCRLPAAGRQR